MNTRVKQLLTRVGTYADVFLCAQAGLFLAAMRAPHVDGFAVLRGRLKRSSILGRAPTHFPILHTSASRNEACDPSCATCASAASCLTCPSGQVLSFGAQLCVSACSPGQFVSASGQCTLCSSCGAGTFQSASCTPTSDTQCRACSSCGPHSYTSVSCTPASDTQVRAYNRGE